MQRRTLSGWFMIVDATAKFQGWPPLVRNAIPPFIMERDPPVEPPLFDRWAAPPLRSIPDFKRAFQGYQKSFWSWLPCYRVEKPGLKAHYLPGGVALSPAGEVVEFADLDLTDVIRQIRLASQ